MVEARKPARRVQLCGASCPFPALLPRGLQYSDSCGWLSFLRPYSQSSAHVGLDSCLGLLTGQGQDESFADMLPPPQIGEWRPTWAHLHSWHLGLRPLSHPKHPFLLGQIGLSPLGTGTNCQNLGEAAMRLQGGPSPPQAMWGAALLRLVGEGGKWAMISPSSLGLTL